MKKFAIFVLAWCIFQALIIINHDTPINTVNLGPAAKTVAAFLNAGAEKGKVLKEMDIARMEAEYEFNKIFDELRKEKEQPDKTYEEMPVCSNSSMKRYMDYRTITDVNSPQYKITRESIFNNDGVLQTKDGYICVALGQKYGKVGDKFLITIGGKDIKCIMADAKAYCDTKDGEGWTDPYGDILEFVVSTEYLNQACSTMGNMDYCNNLSGPITRILKEV